MWQDCHHPLSQVLVHETWLTIKPLLPEITHSPRILHPGLQAAVSNLLEMALEVILSFSCWLSGFPPIRDMLEEGEDLGG